MLLMLVDFFKISNLPPKIEFASFRFSLKFVYTRYINYMIPSLKKWVGTGGT